MTKPIILQMGAYPEWDEIPLNAQYDVRRYFDAADKDAFLAEHGKDIRAIATRGELGATRAHIEACPNLELISVYGVGYDAVDLQACRDHGIKVTNTPDVLSADVADLAVAMMLASSRKLVEADAWARSGDWEKKGGFPLNRRVWGRRAGVLGLGRIGHEIAKRLAGFDMDISYSGSAPKDYGSAWTFYKSPIELAQNCDFLFIACSASAATRHIVNQDVLNALGEEGTVINVSRASNIDEDALIKSLETGTIAGAALDVFEGEPALDPRFKTLSNIVLQPHCGSGTFETRKAMGALVRENLDCHFAGRPLPTQVEL
ncbi:lactate dehydrogenase-like 2-hydroxyacid dehydrogenase [Pacificibacter maritimus]|uniref:Lactate dehydrogenase-like 2-hydroxyacid dehydrogenase n=1 Tax=Pacificibacter maritimus TaxID=762213 RepID=A0A3N4U737_9RHOB|nr:2-hydroxyacid dehydrogenase [Pacificibacter maritimus]RPE66563.1 lactate dehydrogenase-like 2-hydroxyacid dehydrogenase [Pacificibacter maritimus]